LAAKPITIRKKWLILMSWNNSNINIPVQFCVYIGKNSSNGSQPQMLIWLLGMVLYKFMLGNAGEDIVEYCEKNKIDSVIMGSRGLNSIKRAVLGSVGDYCAHHCPCPVVIVKHP
jgi:hypothetical protein